MRRLGSGWPRWTRNWPTCVRPTTHSARSGRWRRTIVAIQEMAERLDCARGRAVRAPRRPEPCLGNHLWPPPRPRAGGQAATEELAELQSEHQMLKQEVDAEDIAAVVSQWTGVPVSRLMEGEMAKLVRLEDVLHQRVVGQDEAVSAVANAIRRSRAGTVGPQPPDRQLPVPRSDRRRQDRAGPSLADYLFDDERAMVRIDMSEYMEKHAVSRLVGAPPATSATTRAASSPRRCVGGPTR